MNERVSPNFVYLDRALGALPLTRPQILDLGCGDGATLRYLRARGHQVSGYDLPFRTDALRERFGGELGKSVRIADDPAVIPFEAAAFDVVYANQVFEHVHPLEAVIRECHRVLKPGGTLIALLPFWSTPVEMHVFVPFVHWMRADRREAYLRAWYRYARRPRKGLGPPDTIARSDAHYLNTQTCYRSRNQIEALLEPWFRNVRLDTPRYVATKLESMKQAAGFARRVASRVLRGVPMPLLAWTVTYLVNASLLATRRES
jgi:SAM-dependent methyltransferase